MLLGGCALTVKSETCQKKSPYIPLSYHWISAKGDRRPVWADIITKLPEIANGWERSELQSMKDFLHAQPVIIGSCLRLMPPAADQIQVATTVQQTETLLARVETHIQAGRIPILKDETKQSLLAQSRAVRDSDIRGPVTLADEETACAAAHLV